MATKLTSTAMVVMAITIWMVMIMVPAKASCTVKNNSGKSLVIIPTVDVTISITVAVGASVELPSSQQNCYLKNGESGHQLGPFSLTDGTVVACVDGTVSGTIDVYATTQPLISAVLSLLSCLPLVSVCLAL